MVSEMGNITQKWVNVLIPFLSDYRDKKSVSKIARESGVPQQTVSRILNFLSNDGLINYSMDGRNKLFYFSGEEKVKMIINILENQMALNFLLKNKKIAVVINDFLKEGSGVILFGSYASGKSDKKSDLDLVVFGCKNIDEISDRYSMKINVHSVSFSDFRKELKSKNPLSLEILKNHIIFGSVSNVVDIFWEVYYG